MFAKNKKTEVKSAEIIEKPLKVKLWFGYKNVSDVDWVAASSEHGAEAATAEDTASGSGEEQTLF